MAEWGDVTDIVEVYCSLAASGLTSTIGAGVWWITLRMSNSIQNVNVKRSGPTIVGPDFLALKF